MSILSTIFSKIFPSSHAAPAPAPAAPGNSGQPTQPPASTAPAAATPAAAPAVQPVSQVDVEKILNDLNAKSAQKLNWKTSIVDLMKLLELDSSLNARKELAKELHYTGDTNDSATMNIWLHKQVMNKVAANGGKVPADLKD
jgi:hypothetical protein